jgi:hypothetical protein
MGEIKIPSDKCLVCGIILSPGFTAEECLSVLEKDFGSRADVSPVMKFDDYSPYYGREMGAGLQRFFVSFQTLFPAGGLAECKTRTNSLEKELFGADRKGKRSVNIDPGCLDLAKLIVATTKDAPFRIYLKDGIYAQPMLRYEGRSFRPFEWTYADYRDDIFISFFNKVREKYKTQAGK